MASGSCFAKVCLVTQTSSLKANHSTLCTVLDIRPFFLSSNGYYNFTKTHQVLNMSEINFPASSTMLLNYN